MTTKRTPRPQFFDLSPAECEALLAGQHVGRLAYSFHDRVAIEPIHYVYEDGWIYGRTSPGSKIVPILHNHWVAFEVDRVRALFDWRSVVARGALYFLDEDGPEPERAAHARALALLRRVVPGTGTSADPVPDRTLVFRIHADELTGRRASARRNGT